MIQVFEKENAVVPSVNRLNIFTTAGYDNADYNPTSNTARYSFHGTAISITQHPTKADDSTDRHVNLYSKTASKNVIGSLPLWYTQQVPTVCENVVYKSSSSATQIDLKPSKLNLDDEKNWLKSVDNNMSSQGSVNMSWSAHHASQARTATRQPCITSLLPLFKEDSKSLTMVRHGFDAVLRATN